MNNGFIRALLTIAGLNLAGCISFARIDGARTLPSNSISFGVVAGASDLATPKSKCKSSDGDFKCAAERSELLKDSPANSPIEIQGAGRYGIIDRLDCGAAISLGLFNGFSADCKWNWFRGEGIASAVSLGGSNTFAHAWYKDYKYITFESHFPYEVWLPISLNQLLGSSENSLVMVIDPFGGNFWKNGKKSSFTAVEFFVGLDGTYGPSRAQIRVGAFGWHATPHKMGGEVEGVGLGAQFNAPLRTAQD